MLVEIGNRLRFESSNDIITVTVFSSEEAKVNTIGQNAMVISDNDNVLKHPVIVHRPKHDFCTDSLGDDAVVIDPHEPYTIEYRNAILEGLDKGRINHIYLVHRRRPAPNWMFRTKRPVYVLPVE